MLNRWIAKSLSASLVALLAIAVVGGSSQGAPAFSMAPVNPAADQAVRFTDTSMGLSAVTWLWDFGDGATSVSPSPSHVYAAAGTYDVRLFVTTSSGTVETARRLQVSPEGTLRLKDGHSFDVSLLAADPETGLTSGGKAIAQGHRFGYFAIPALGSSEDPQVFVKIEKGSGGNGEFSVRHGALADLDYTLTVRENQTGVERRYRGDRRVAKGVLDTSQQQCGDPRQVGFRASQSPPAPTPTPTSGSGGPAQTISIDVTTWQYTPGTASPIEVTAGVATTLVFTSSNGTHGFSGIPELSIAGSNGISSGEAGDYGSPGTSASVYRVTFTAPASARGRSFPFNCTVTTCGAGHSTMIGTLRVN